MRSVTLKCDGVECTVSDDSGDLTIYTYVDLIKQCLVGVGFHPYNVDDVFHDEARWSLPRKENSC